MCGSAIQILKVSFAVNPDQKMFWYWQKIKSVLKLAGGIFFFDKTCINFEIHILNKFFDKNFNELSIEFNRFVIYIAIQCIHGVCILMHVQQEI